MNLETYAKKTWCPGCGNFGILSAFQQALNDLEKEKRMKQEEFVIVTGIGCHGKIFDYLKLSGFYGLHGRTLPVSIGIKVSNPKLHVIAFAGDGDTYCEGISHFIHACNYNYDVKLFVHNNQVFALTTGQPTATTETNFVSPTTPYGKKEKPLNPVLLALISGATFVARAFAIDVDYLKEIMKKAILHKGFSFVDILQPCVSYHRTAKFFRKSLYRLEEFGHDPSDFRAALEKALEWDYSMEEGRRIPIGVFYQKETNTMEEKLKIKKPFYKVHRNVNIKKLVEEFK